MNKNTRISNFKQKPELLDHTSEHTLLVTHSVDRYLPERTSFGCSNGLNPKGTKVES